MSTKNSSQKKEALSIKDKVDHIFDETRVVLPGTQALLGFQLTAFFSNNFSSLPDLLKYTHLISLAFIALSVILLMAPVAYHRIVESGEDTEQFHDFSSKVLVIVLITLALGLATDFFVVVSITVKSQQFAFIASLIALLSAYLLWFGYTLVKRKKE